MPNPSMLEGLHQKLLGNGFLAVLVFGPQVLAVSNVVPSGKTPGTALFVWNGSDPAGKFAPFDSTVMAAPSNAPIRVGSCNNSARLPLREAVQPTTASSGNRSICGLLEAGGKKSQPARPGGFTRLG